MTGDDTARAVLEFAQQIIAPQIVIGATRRSRLKEHGRFLHRRTHPDETRGAVR